MINVRTLSGKDLSDLHARIEEEVDRRVDITMSLRGAKDEDLLTELVSRGWRVESDAREREIPEEYGHDPHDASPASGPMGRRIKLFGPGKHDR